MNIFSFPSDGPVTVKDLIDCYNVMGIPHFQRGLVWNDENTSLLLESLYFETPCGTVILWEPENPKKEGIPLSTPDDMRYLIIDGQQRIRSLYNALGPDRERLNQDLSDDDEGEHGDIETNVQRVWCLNLSRVPGLNEFFDTGMSRYRMFHFVVDPRVGGKRGRYNLIPLNLFFDRNADIQEFIHPTNATPHEVMRKIEEISLRDNICSLFGRKVFSLKIYSESRQGYKLANVVALYNRINSAGKRVESEEKAFATLVSLYPSTNQWLREVFESVHERSDVPPKDLKRDDVLKRRKERNFGFKLFIRTFVQVCAYHFGSSLGSNSFSFEVVNNVPFQMRLKSDLEATQGLFDRTRGVICFVRQLLRDGLKCDDLQTLPDTTSLLPLFQVLIRFPKLMEPEIQEYLPMLQCLTLRLLLSQNPTHERILNLVKLVNRAEKAKDCFENLETKVERPTELRKKLPTRLEKSNAPQDRYTLMLYWLLRKREVCDFSYENLDEEKYKHMRKKYEKELPLEDRVKPEKQHIVPYSLLAKLYNLEKRGRVSRHQSNNIGNITYISHEFNDIKTGLANKPIDLVLDPPDNLEGHFLGTTGNVRHMYEKAKKKAMKADVADRDKARRAFEGFCKRRRELIADAFVKWVEELTPELTISERVEPEARVDPSLQDQVRQKDYPDDMEDAVLELVADRSLRFKLLRRKQIAKEDLVRRVSSSSDHKGFIIWFLDDQLEVEPAPSSALYEKLEGLMTGKIPRAKKGVDLGNWVLPARGEESEITVRILVEFAQLLSGVNTK
jgi:hypothetical protein